MHLKEGVLEDVFSRGPGAEESVEKLDEVAAVSLDQGGEGRAISGAIRHEEFLVRS
jgi:hypothetical protein